MMDFACPHAPRLFGDCTAIRALADGLLAATLPRASWTHEAHLAATLCLVMERPDIDLDAELGGIIRRYNVAAGGENTDTAGYHETITRFYLEALRRFAAAAPAGERLVETVNRLLASPVGDRNYPLRYYSRERLFSVAARRAWLAPDLQELAV